MAETKIIYHMDEEETPYLVKVAVPPDRVTLGHFKQVLNNRPSSSFKFFFKSMDLDFGVVKEEISDDNAKLPCFNGRVVSWLVLAEGSASDGGSQCADSMSELPPPIERTGGIGDSRPPSFHANTAGSRDGLDNETGAESILSIRRERDRHRRRNREREVHDDVPRVNGHTKPDRHRNAGGYESASTVMSSELDSSSFIDSDDDNTSRLSSSVEQSASSRLMRRHKRRRRRHRMRQMDRSSSLSSITDSTMSLNIIAVTLNMEKYNFLGISIVGQSNDRGDGGIYIGSIMKGGAVAADGRIEPGDMLLQVNDVNFENMSNDDAVRILREIVSKPGPISLTVAKCWDPTPRSYFTIPRTEPVRPIDPAAWISHTTAMTGTFPRYGMSPTTSAITSTSSSLTSSIPDSEKYEDCPLTVKSDMPVIVKAMQLSDSGLEIRNRLWLKITISNAVIDLAGLSLNEGSSSTSEHDILPPLPHPTCAWPLTQGFPYQYPLPHPYYSPNCQDPTLNYGNGSAGSQQSEGSKSSGSNRSIGERRGSAGKEKEQKADSKSVGNTSEPDRTIGNNVHCERPASQLSHHSHCSHGPPGVPPVYQLPTALVTSGPPGAPPVRDLAAVPPELMGSRQSFQKAMGNPCEFFIDIM
ncbi:segment polarity protein dishevelled homolog DVL-1-like isoform X3 [Carcharodon carcharias]|uniref:segment polarity protein dishevelled homolog DVL-1-like isoform X3 n=1 Tax=Carcharodon carcharias TaxID=13397 RepID=UPI001B7EE1EF|nr:segment polarity protein dishevelled homolog DVL-1-like isoform X3 [Carcharodon carcharias]